MEHAETIMKSTQGYNEDGDRQRDSAVNMMKEIRISRILIEDVMYFIFIFPDKVDNHCQTI